MALTTEQVWEALDESIFGVLACVNQDGEPRTAGVCYVTEGRSLLIVSDSEAWKVRHIYRNPHVSMTVTLPKRIPFLPFIKVPAATITFQGEAEILEAADVDSAVIGRLLRGLELDQEYKTRVIRVVPHGEFVTYGIGMPLLRMRRPEEAKGRAACQTEPVRSGSRPERRPSVRQARPARAGQSGIVSGHDPLLGSFPSAFDGVADDASPLGPAPVVDANGATPQDSRQGEPPEGRPVAEAAVGHDLGI